MRKLLLCYFTVLFAAITAYGQTAADFTANDCAGFPHNLFSELDEGKVIVIAWVMPCGSCIEPALNAYSEVQNYESSHPGKVIFYLVDDYANTSCMSLKNWANNNGMGDATTFSSPVISMEDYGSPGMPKIVVIGSNREVYFNQNNALNTSLFNKAIDNALGVSGIFEYASADFQTRLFPNPIGNTPVSFSYSIGTASEVNVEVYNSLGARVSIIPLGMQVKGTHEVPVNLDQLSNGQYYFKLSAGDDAQVIKFTVSR